MNSPQAEEPCGQSSSTGRAGLQSPGHANKNCTSSCRACGNMPSLLRRKQVQGPSSIQKMQEEDPAKITRKWRAGPPRVRGGDLNFTRHQKIARAFNAAARTARVPSGLAIFHARRKSIRDMTGATEKVRDNKDKDPRMEGRRTPRMETPPTTHLRARYRSSACGLSAARPHKQVNARA